MVRNELVLGRKEKEKKKKGKKDVVLVLVLILRSISLIGCWENIDVNDLVSQAVDLAVTKLSLAACLTKATKRGRIRKFSTKKRILEVEIYSKICHQPMLHSPSFWNCAAGRGYTAYSPRCDIGNGG